MTSSLSRSFPFRGGSAATRPRPSRLRRLAATFGVDRERGRRRRADERLRVLRRFAQRSEVPESTRLFFTEALLRLSRLVGRLRELEVDDELVLGWLESVLATLEREAARVRGLARVREAMRGPLPSTLVEEELMRRACEESSRDVTEVDRERQELIEELDGLLADVGVAPAPGGAAAGPAGS